eukprot:TRINITY_DN3137_c0_g1_i1.p1 TRINITY_DN3137_c0_g1~~TRINITY_DN3137_c0_g1_i1.p1  ORF type:complete len:264 (-),score=79.01 TRINITY_DN3137_c0_g1_i1:140-931(-)
MCHCIEKVFQLAVATFSKKTPSEAAKKNLDILIAQTNKLTGADVGLDLCSVLNSGSPKNTSDSHDSCDNYTHGMSSKAPVTYIPVSENKDVSMGIFIIREGQGIPLHDHPHMHGIIKCLKGNLKITSFTKKEDQQVGRLPDRIKRSPQLVDKVKYGELFLAEQGEQTNLNPESGSCVLGPHKSNIHRVESVGGPAAFLDILAPPYNIDPPHFAEDKQERDCHYFRELSEANENPNCKWLILSEPPASFFCDTEPYMGPRIKSE